MTSACIAGCPRRGRHSRGRYALWALLSLATFGCAGSMERTYVEVRVTIDESVTSTQLYLVTSCDVQVHSTEVVAPFNLPCKENRVPRDVGTFQWVSQAQSGTLDFVVHILDANNVVVGQGQSEVIPVAPGKAPIKTTVVVKSVLPSGGNDAGIEAGTAPDSGLAVDVDVDVDVGSSDGGNGGDGGVADIDAAPTTDDDSIDGSTI